MTSKGRHSIKAHKYTETSSRKVMKKIVTRAGKDADDPEPSSAVCGDLK